MWVKHASGSGPARNSVGEISGPGLTTAKRYRSRTLPAHSNRSFPSTSTSGRSCTMLQRSPLTERGNIPKVRVSSVHAFRVRPRLRITEHARPWLRTVEHVRIRQVCPGSLGPNGILAIDSPSILPHQGSHPTHGKELRRNPLWDHS